MRDRSLPHVERAAELVRDAPPSLAKARVLAEVSRQKVLGGEEEEGLEIAREAYATADQLGLTELAARALNNIGIARMDLGDYAGAVADLERSIELALSVNSPEAARAYNNLGAVTWAREGPGKAKDFFVEAMRAGERFGNTLVGDFARSIITEVLLVLGEWDEALARTDALIAAREAGSPPQYQEAGWYLHRATIRHARGAAEAEIVEDLQRGLETARRIGDPQVMIPTLATTTRILAELGRLHEARAHADELRDISSLTRWLGYFADFALVAPELGEEDLVRSVVAAAPEDDPWKRALEAMMDGESARAADIMRGTDRLLSEAQLRLRAARELVAQGRRAEADVQLQKSLAFWRSVGASRYVAECEALRAQAATG